jgi:hypothetical protein
MAPTSRLGMVAKYASLIINTLFFVRLTPAPAPARSSPTRAFAATHSNGQAWHTHTHARTHTVLGHCPDRAGRPCAARRAGRPRVDLGRRRCVPPPRRETQRGPSAARRHSRRGRLCPSVSVYMCVRVSLCVFVYVLLCGWFRRGGPGRAAEHHFLCRLHWRRPREPLLPLPRTQPSAHTDRLCVCVCVCVCVRVCVCACVRVCRGLMGACADPPSTLALCWCLR